MKRIGFAPALVVETSPRNFRAWLKHERILDQQTSSCAARELARRFSGDPSSADWRHFGRLAGFTNQKPRRRLPNGYQPFVKLWEYTGRTYNAAEEFIDQVTVIVQQELAERNTPQSFPPRRGHYLNQGPTRLPRRSAIRRRSSSRRSGLGGTCPSRGISEQQIRDEILYARDLSKKGRPQRQLDYAERTALKALAIVQPTR
jgi:hypothetical protein